MKKENSINSQKCLEMDLNETSLAQLILENFAVNKETYKILLDIMYGDEGDEGIRLSSVDQTAQGLRNSRQKRLRKTRTKNGKSECNESALEARDAQITLLEQQLAHQEDWAKYWKNKYEACFEELKKKSDKWWKF